MNQHNSSHLAAFWHAYQSQDTEAGRRSLAAAGYSEEVTSTAFGAISRMASEARDFGHFAQIFGGEAPMKTKLSVAEAASLQMASREQSRIWEGNGGRTWEGSSR